MGGNKTEDREVRLPKLQWACIDPSGKRIVADVPNPVEGIVNRFNELYADRGWKAEPVST